MCVLVLTPLPNSCVLLVRSLGFSVPPVFTSVKIRQYIPFLPHSAVVRIRPNKINFVNMLFKVWNATQVQDIIKIMIPQKDFPSTINRLSF